MSDLETYKRFVEIVLKECDGADENEVATEFRRYQDDFLIPPDESMRSIIRKFSPDGSEGSLSQGERWKAITGTCQVNARCVHLRPFKTNA